MINEADVIRALDKPRKLYSIQQVINPGAKNTDELQAVLLRMRDAGKVAFDINSGHWRRKEGKR